MGIPTYELEMTETFGLAIWENLRIEHLACWGILGLGTWH